MKDLLDLQFELMDLSLEYWERQDEIEKKDGTIVGPVKYLKNNETGQLVIITKGEYSDVLIKFVERL